jgi:hypothetical protein
MFLSFQMNQRRLAEFVDWCTAKGVEFDLVEPVYYGPDRGCGLRAKRTVRWNEKFLKVGLGLELRLRSRMVVNLKIGQGKF